MKKFFKKADEILKNEPAHIRAGVWVIVTLFFFLFAWLIGLIAVAIVRNIEMISGLLLLFFLYCGESLVNYWKNRKRHNDQTCTGCGGCANYYPAIRTVMFTALRQCAPALSFHPPETETAIVSSVQSMADAVPRFQFKILKKPGKQTELSNAVLTSCLQEAVNDAFAAYVSAFAGCKMHGLYIEEIREQNMYTYLIAVLPICEKTLPHIRNKEQQRISGEKQMLSAPNERVYDDDF